MTAWTNVILMVATALLSIYFYCISVGQASLEKKIGRKAYEKSTRYRWISIILMVIHLIQYVIYVFYPLDLPIPETFPWAWWINLLIAVIIALPASVLMKKAIRYAGLESVITKKKHRLFRGVYRKIRHPMALAELPFIWSLAFLLNSPFLVLFSFIWVPLFYFMCVTEEKDLVIRYGKPYIRYKSSTGMFFPKRRKG
jgi:methanethiol S-methyltransferase